MIRQLFNRITFLLLTVGFSSCTGQVKDDIQKKEVSHSRVVSDKQPKLIRTQGSHEGDNVHCSLQDNAGNLWFGTTGEGVYKYDGVSFSQFTMADGLYSNTVWCIFEDNEGVIWIGTDAGLNFYDGKTFSQIRITPPSKSNFNPSTFEKYTQTNMYDVFRIMQDRSGNIWFATVDGVYIYDGISFNPFIVNERGVGYKNPKKNNVEYILEDNSGNIWFGGRGNDGVFRYDGKSITNFKIKELDGHNWAWPVLQDKNGNIWFSNWGGAYRYDGKSFTTFTKNDGLLSNVVARMIEDKNGNLWFGGGGVDGGVCRYDGKSFTNFTTKDGLTHNGVWTILEDTTGNIWIGTRNMGLCKYDGKTFKRFSE